MSNLVPQRPDVPAVAQNVPAPSTNVNTTAIASNIINILGYNFKKTHVYVVVGIAVLVLGYFIYKWYVKDTESDPKEEFNDEDFDDQLVYPEEDYQEVQQDQEQDPLQEIN